MPIIVSHQPSMQSLAQAGYYEGAGQFMQEQREFQQRERMQVRQQQNQLLMQERDRMMRAQSEQFRRESFLMTGKQRIDAQKAMMFAEQQFEEQMRKIQQEEKKDLIRMEFDERMKAEEYRAKNEIERDLIKFYSNRISSRQNAIEEALESAVYTDEEQLEHDKRMKEAGVIQNDKTVEPLQRMAAWEAKLNQVPIASKDPITKEEDLEGHIAQRKDGTEWIRNEKGWTQIQPEDAPDPGDTLLDRVMSLDDPTAALDKIGKMLVTGKDPTSITAKQIARDTAEYFRELEKELRNPTKAPGIPDGPSSPYPRQGGGGSSGGTTFQLDESQGPNGFSVVP